MYLPFCSLHTLLSFALAHSPLTSHALPPPQIEPETRISLYKLRQTWKAFIANKKLVAIDKHVHALDRNWPITATDTASPPSPTIHVNPQFLAVSWPVHV